MVITTGGDCGCGCIMDLARADYAINRYIAADLQCAHANHEWAEVVFSRSFPKV